MSYLFSHSFIGTFMYETDLLSFDFQYQKKMENRKWQLVLLVITETGDLLDTTNR